MSQTRNRLLAVLGSLGLIGGAGAADDAKAAVVGPDTGVYGSFGELFAYARQSLSDDLRTKIDFLRAYPDSAQATRVREEIVAELAGMPSGERRQVMNEITALLGVRASGSGPQTPAEIAALFETMTTAAVRDSGTAAGGATGGSDSDRQTSIY